MAQYHLTLSGDTMRELPPGGGVCIGIIGGLILWAIIFALVKAHL